MRRSYSICSEPNEESFEVGIKKVQNGIFSTYVNEKLRIGDSIKVGTPEGRFIWEPNENDKIILTPHIAGWTHESHLKLAKVIVQKIQKNPLLVTSTLKH